MAQHTPGPWFAVKDKASETNSVYDQGGRLLAEYLTDANANLIVSAPDMLAALILLEAEMVLSGNAESRDYGWRPAITATRAAIAKATGEVAP